MSQTAFLHILSPHTTRRMVWKTGEALLKCSSDDLIEILDVIGNSVVIVATSGLSTGGIHSSLGPGPPAKCRNICSRTAIGFILMLCNVVFHSTRLLWSRRRSETAADETVGGLTAGLRLLGGPTS